MVRFELRFELDCDARTHTCLFQNTSIKFYRWSTENEAKFDGFKNMHTAMLLTAIEKLSGKLSVDSSTANRRTSLKLVGFLAWTCLFGTVHMFSVGFNSGLWEGHPKTIP